MYGCYWFAVYGEKNIRNTPNGGQETYKHKLIVLGDVWEIGQNP